MMIESTKTRQLGSMLMILFLLGSSYAQTKSMEMIITRSGSQPSTAGPPQRFAGSVRVDTLFEAKAPSRTYGAYVTFAPGGRSAWHSHPLGQTLIVTKGVGRVQRRGGSVQEIREGDVIWTPPGVQHWHGSSPSTEMTHLAITEQLEGIPVEWFEHVTDEQYGSPVKEQGDTAVKDKDGLNAKQKRIVAISALTARGDLEKLRKALNDGLDAGLTINETKEVLVHLYAYCGIPRSLQGINTLIAVLEERKKKGIKDVAGRSASPIPDSESKYERGKRNLEKLTGRPEPAQKTGYAVFSPEIEVFLKEHLFADIFERDVLNFQDREITTISALIALGGVEPMMQSHMTIGLNVGLSEAGLGQIISTVESNVGRNEADEGRRVLTKVISARRSSK